MTPLDAYEAALALAEHGLTPDSATRADLDAAADHAGVTRAGDAHDRHLVRDALHAITTPGAAS